ncbi:MAG: sporulation integral membrane protein YlbJ, partial [Paraclostridium sp.]
SFCSTSGPLFMVGAVAIGMFNNPTLGYLILICHYLGSLTVGLLFRNYGNESIVSRKLNVRIEIDKVISSRNNDNRGFFVLFGDAVYNGINTILAVGGFVIVFSVVFKILSIFNFIEIIATIIYIPLSIVGISKELCFAFISGLFEITIGCSQVSSVSSSPEILRASLCSFIIAFSGLSILAQCCSFLAKTDIKTTTYILSKLLHGVFAFLFTFALYPLCNSDAIVSTFDIAYNIIYDNFIWNYYISNYQVFLPLLIIIYIVTTFIIIKKSKHKVHY